MEVSVPRVLVLVGDPQLGFTTIQEIWLTETTGPKSKPKAGTAYY